MTHRSIIWIAIMVGGVGAGIYMHRSDKKSEAELADRREKRHEKRRQAGRV